MHGAGRWLVAALLHNSRRDLQGHGPGTACSHCASGAAKPAHSTGEPHAMVNLKLDFDAGIRALTKEANIDQGSTAIFVLAAARVLGGALSRVRVIANDTVITRKDNGSHSPRVTFMAGNATIEAARRLCAIAWWRAPRLLAKLQSG